MTMHHNQVEFIPKTKAWFKIWKSINVIFNVIYRINRIKEKNHMIISKNLGEAVEKKTKTQHSYML